MKTSGIKNPRLPTLALSISVLAVVLALISIFGGSEKPAPKPDKIDRVHYDIYLSSKFSDQVDLDKLIEMDEESPTYLFEAKNYNLDLEKKFICARGVRTIIYTASAGDGQNLAPVRTSPTDINISLLLKWNTVVLVEYGASAGEYYVSMYGRTHKRGQPYELLVPRHQVNG